MKARPTKIPPTVALEGWMADARCRDNPHFSTYPAELRAPYCGTCPVITECVEAGMFDIDGNDSGQPDAIALFPCGHKNIRGNLVITGSGYGCRSCARKAKI